MSDDKDDSTMDTPEDGTPEDSTSPSEPDPEEVPKRFEKKEREEREPLSDDPDVNAIGELGYEEALRISKDPDDHRQEAAEEYVRLYGKYLMDGFSPLTDAINKQYADLWKNVIGKAVPKIELPKFDTPKIKLPTVDLPSITPKVDLRDLAEVRNPVSELDVVREAASGPQLPKPSRPWEEVVRELQASTATMVETNARLSEMVDQSRAAATASATLMAATNKALEEQLQQAKEDAVDQRKSAEKSDRHAVKARRQTWIAIGITVVVGVAQIAVAICTSG